jgi:N4-(beta-N-acetylglucosaminyl)-L-asparaginase
VTLDALIMDGATVAPSSSFGLPPSLPHYLPPSLPASLPVSLPPSLPPSLTTASSQMEVGSVAFLSKFRQAAKVARAVMEYTDHTLLVGEGAEDFAQMIGIPSENTNTAESRQVYEDWQSANCQPNFYRNLEGCDHKCGPYPSPDSSLAHGLKTTGGAVESGSLHVPWVDEGLHDTIGVVAIDGNGNMACGTTTNGANHKVALPSSPSLTSPPSSGARACR